MAENIAVEEFGGTIQISANPYTNYERFSNVYDALLKVPDSNVGHAAMKKSERIDGGYYRSQFRLFDTPGNLVEMFFMGLNRIVKMYSENGNQVFEGIIANMILHFKGVDLGISLTTVFNKLTMECQIAGAADVDYTAEAEDVQSQSQFGYRQAFMSGGEMASVDVAEQACEMLLRDMSLPRISINNLKIGTPLGSAVSLDIVCFGLFDMLDNQAYDNIAAEGSDSVTNVLEAIIAAKAQFVAETRIMENGTPVTIYYDSHRTPKALSLNFAKLGDSNFNRWRVGMTNGGVFVFEPAAQIERTV